MNPHDDVIAAIATPVGEGGIAVIRVSGNKSVGVVDRSFRGKHPLTDVASHTAHFGFFVNGKNQKIDEVVVTVFCSPHSYTGENVVEISCHGGIYVSKTILETLLLSGARHADPGEFTKRRFLNGKTDLSQAEAVADLIHAKSEHAHRLSLDQLDGRISHKVNDLRHQLLSICSLLELELDFVEEGLIINSKEKILNDLTSASDEINQMINTYTHGRIHRDGFKVVLVGKPNVGKSSILNTLLDKNRAIVTPHPGTTRDFIEENITLNGMLFRLVDTAGLRETEDEIELEGIRRTKKEIDSADLILSIIDISQIADIKHDAVEKIFLEDIKIPVVRVINKVDLANIYEKTWENNDCGYDAVVISAKTGYGMDSLKKIISIRAIKTDLRDQESITITNLRHFKCLQESSKFIISAMDLVRKDISSEFVVADLRTAMQKMEMIIGTVTSEDVLNAIFSDFCIGK